MLTIVTLLLLLCFVPFATRTERTAADDEQSHRALLRELRRLPHD